MTPCGCFRRRSKKNQTASWKSHGAAGPRRSRFSTGGGLRNGVVDLAWTAHTYNVAQLPVVEGAKLSKLTPAQEREKGVFAFTRTCYQKKLNAAYLGRGTPGLTYNLYTTVPVKSLADFKGLSIRVTPAYKAFVEAMGAAPVAQTRVRSSPPWSATW